MWDKLNLDWVDATYYNHSESPGDLPYLKRKVPDLYELLKTQKAETYHDDMPHTFNGMKNKKWTGFDAQNDWKFSKSFIKNFDCIMFNHFPESVLKNIGAMRDKIVILKTYNMHSKADENCIHNLKNKYGVKIVRNSPNEHKTFGKNYAGHDAIIRGSVVKDEYEISGWDGSIKEICTFSSFFSSPDAAAKQRKNYYEDIKKRLNFVPSRTPDLLKSRFNGAKFPMNLFGVGNDEYVGKDAFISHSDKLRVLRSFRVNLVVGTPRSTNTYSFVEAWVMGQPIVAFGPKMWQSPSCEITDLIDNGQNGFYSDSVDEIVEQCRLLMGDDSLAKKISENSRKKAVSIYGRDVLAEQWRKFFKECGLSL